MIARTSAPNPSQATKNYEDPYDEHRDLKDRLGSRSTTTDMKRFTYGRRREQKRTRGALLAARSSAVSIEIVGIGSVLQLERRRVLLKPIV
jgi:hypothetical protein